MAEEWFYARDGQKHGPVTPQDLRRLASAGLMLPTDLIWKKGMPQWVPASSAKGLYPEGPPPIPTVAPVPQPPMSAPQVATSRPRMQRKRSSMLPAALFAVFVVAGVGAAVLMIGGGVLPGRNPKTQKVAVGGRRSDSPKSSSSRGLKPAKPEEGGKPVPPRPGNNDPQWATPTPTTRQPKPAQPTGSIPVPGVNTTPPIPDIPNIGGVLQDVTGAVGRLGDSIESQKRVDQEQRDAETQRALDEQRRKEAARPVRSRPSEPPDTPPPQVPSPSLSLTKVCGGSITNETIDSSKNNAVRCRFSPDGQVMAIGTSGGLLYLLDRRTGKVVLQSELFPGEKGVEKDDAPVTDIAFSPDGSRVVWSTERFRIGIAEVKDRRVTWYSPQTTRDSAGRGLRRKECGNDDLVRICVPDNDTVLLASRTGVLAIRTDGTASLLNGRSPFDRFIHFDGKFPFSVEEPTAGLKLKGGGRDALGGKADVGEWPTDGLDMKAIQQGIREINVPDTGRPRNKGQTWADYSGVAGVAFLPDNRTVAIYGNPKQELGYRGFSGGPSRDPESWRLMTYEVGGKKKTDRAIFLKDDPRDDYPFANMSCCGEASVLSGGFGIFRYGLDAGGELLASRPGGGTMFSSTVHPRLPIVFADREGGLFAAHIGHPGAAKGANILVEQRVGNGDSVTCLSAKGDVIGVACQKDFAVFEVSVGETE